jgi:bacterioferritin-associated ferredoxin
VLVCHCRRVNDRMIRQAAKAGARTCAEVGDACGAGTGCGGCHPTIEGLLRSERAAEGGASLPVVRAPEPGT